MNAKVIYATLAGAVVSFFLGWLVYGMLLQGVYSSVTTRVEGLERGENMVWWALIAAQVAWALAYALIYDRWAKISTFAAGAIAGAWLSGLFSLSIDLSFYSMQTNYSVQWVLLDTVVGAVMGAIMGGVVGWVLGLGKK